MQCEQGYATTDRALTRSVYWDVLKDTFDGEWQSCTLSVIWPYRCIYPHQDGIEAGVQRYFLVMQSNPDSWVLHDGDWQQLEEGGVYVVDPTKTHASVNLGNEIRINFIVDVKTNVSRA